MDNLLLLLRRKAASGDITDLRNYTTALERLVGFDAASPKLELFLMSEEGERHEDRLPIAIFSSQQTAFKTVEKYAALLKADIEESYDELGSDSDYGPGVIWYINGEDETSLFLEKFEVDPIEIFNSSNNTLDHKDDDDDDDDEDDDDEDDDS